MVSTELEVLHQSLNLILNTLCHLGLSPIYWDKQNKCAKILNSKIHWKAYYKWKVTILGIILTELMLIKAFVNTSMHYGFKFTDMHFLYCGVTTATAGIAALFHLHTAFRHHEICIMINSLLSLQIKCSKNWQEVVNSRKNCTSMLKDNNTDNRINLHKRSTTAKAKSIETDLKYTSNYKIATIINNFAFYSFVFLCSTSPVLYILKCEYHLLSPILSVCPNNVNDQSPYLWIVLYPLYMVILEFWAVSQGISILTAVCTISLTAIYCNYLIRKLKLG